MKQRPWRRALSLVLAFALIFAMPCVTCVYADGEVDYVERKWNESTQVVDSSVQSVTDYTVIGENTATWNGSINNGWYVVKDTVTINQRVEVTGDVKLILTDGCKLTIDGGIQVAQGNSLTIYGQSEGTGQLTATAQWGTLNAGIGGNGSNDGGDRFAGTITIHGGQVTATGNIGAGIGGDAGGDGGKITIFGGKVTATGNYGGAGIGGGNGGDGGEITIYGGKITAKGTGNYGAGIGGGYLGSGGTIAIYGGKVTATGGNYGAGIGGGRWCDGGTIIIQGGTVEAQGGDYGAGIGGGSGGSGGKITIQGGEVTAQGGTDGAGIGGGADGDGGTFSTESQDSTGGNAVIFASNIQDINGQTNWQGVFFLGEQDGKIYGASVTPTDDFTIPNGKTLTIEEDKTLIIRQGVTLTVAQGGTLANNEGTIIVYGTLTGTVSGNGEVIYKVTGITLDRSTLPLTVGQTETLTATVQPSNATNKTVTWKSSNENVATVTADSANSTQATVTAVAAGETTITVTAADGSFTATCTVKVEQPVTGITLDHSTLSLTVGQEKILTVTISPDNASNKDVTWKSDNPNVATVENGTVTAMKAGTATITVTTQNGGFTATCTVTVTRPASTSGGSTASPLPSAPADGAQPGDSGQDSTGQGDGFSQPAGCVSDTVGEVSVSGAYQFRLTSTNGAVPVVELSSTAFRGVFASQEGNDYFYKVYAVGQTGQTCTVTVNGTAVARLTASAAYGGVESDTTAPFTVPQGGAYQFRLTADAKPTLAAGSPSFTVEYAGNEGRDWFFKVYAIGKPGDGCGFYVNGAPVPVAVAHIS